jgi:hypothetical protein
MGIERSTRASSCLQYVHSDYFYRLHSRGEITGAISRRTLISATSSAAPVPIAYAANEIARYFEGRVKRG